jgi:exosome complex RNA-binding protein Rrp4
LKNDEPILDEMQPSLVPRICLGLCFSLAKTGARIMQCSVFVCNNGLVKRSINKAKAEPSPMD